MLNKSALSAAVMIATLAAAAPVAAVEEHHPAGASGSPATTAPAPQAVPAAPGGKPGGMGMMGGQSGMGMMGGHGMGMMGGHGMGMMGGPMGGGMGMGMPGPDITQHLDGRIAFLKAELKITSAQEQAWTGFAEALRASAASMGQMRTMMGGMQTASVEQRLEQKEKLLATQLDNAKRLRTAYGKLAGLFSDEQKKAAEQLIGMHVGMM